MYAASRSDEKFLRKIKGFDFCQIPAYWKFLKRKLLRAIFFNLMWQNATETSIDSKIDNSEDASDLEFDAQSSSDEADDD